MKFIEIDFKNGGLRVLETLLLEMDRDKTVWENAWVPIRVSCSVLESGL